MSGEYRDVLEIAHRALFDACAYNEGEPCWCPDWWWMEQTGPSEGDHTEACDHKRALYEWIGERLAAAAGAVETQRPERPETP